MKFIFLIPSAVILSGCGGLANLLPEEEADPTEVSLGQIQNLAASGELGDIGADALASFEQLQNSTLDPASSIPTSDVVEYSGHIGFGDVNDGVLGELNLELDLTEDAEAISGTANAFIDESGQPVQGQLTLSNVSVNRNANPETDWQITSSLDGTLEWNETIENVFGSIYGEFQNSAEIIGGGAEFYSLEQSTTIKGGFAVASQ